MTKNADRDKYSYLGYDNRFDAGSALSLASPWIRENVIFGKDNSPLAHADNRKQNNLIIGKGLTNELDDTAIKAETDYSIIITKSKKMYVSLHYNGSNTCFYGNAVNIYQLKEKDFEIKAYQLYLDNILKGFTVGYDFRTDFWFWFCWLWYYWY